MGQGSSDFAHFEMFMSLTPVLPCEVAWVAHALCANLKLGIVQTTIVIEYTHHSPTKEATRDKRINDNSIGSRNSVLMQLDIWLSACRGDLS